MCRRVEKRQGISFEKYICLEGDKRKLFKETESLTPDSGKYPKIPLLPEHIEVWRDQGS